MIPLKFYSGLPMGGAGMTAAGKSVEETLLAWQQLAGIGKRPATVRYHSQLLAMFRRFWPDLKQVATRVTADDVTAFVLCVAHFSAPLYNALVSVLRSEFRDASRRLKRRSVTFVAASRIVQEGAGERLRARRMFATRAIECGVDLPTAARWLGHSDGGALLGKTYFHLLDQHSAAMAGRVAISA